MRKSSAVLVLTLSIAGLTIPGAQADPLRTVYVRADSTSADAVTGNSCLDPNYQGSNGLKSAITNAQSGDLIVLCNETVYEEFPNNRTFSLSNTTLTVDVTFTSDVSNLNRRPKILTNNFAINTDPSVTTVFTDMNFVESTSTGSGKGGAIELKSGILQLDRMVFDSNTATYGGAIALTSGTGAAQLNVNRSTFVSNTADTNGGAIFVGASDTANITNTIFYKNETTNGNGAAVFATTGNANISFANIVNNTGSSVLNGAGITLTNSILGQRLMNETLCANSVEIGDGNFISDDSCGDLPAYASNVKDVSVEIPYGQIRIGRIYEPVEGGLQYFRVLSESPAIDYITFDEQEDSSTSIVGQTNNRPYSVEGSLEERADVGAVEVTSIKLDVREIDSELTYGGLIVAEKLSVGGTMIPTSVAKIMTPLEIYSVTGKRIDRENNAIITTHERHNLRVGMTVELSGVGSGLNGAHRITAISSRTFTFDTSGNELEQTSVSPWGQVVHKEKAVVTYTSLTPETCTLVSSKNPAIIPQVDAGVCEIEMYSPAVNGYEEVYEFVSLQMLIQVKPSKPLNVRTSKITKGGVTVTWDKPITTGKAKLLRYEVSFYRQSKPKEVRLTVKVSPYKLTAAITKLASNMPYIVRVKAITGAGTSPASADVRFKTKK
ncbi:MAG: hypothetical protein RLZZ330_531 [Actinomycetota bacterium]